ncbi:MAG TPA: DUF1003 domain-containing protein [Abditibacteriaceae bacterium]|jgi:uncharacterized membrane protein
MPHTYNEPSVGSTHDTGMSHIVERNIQALLARRKEEERQKSLEERIADNITRFTGSMAFVYIHLLGFATWIIINLGWTPLPQFDKSFVILAMFASVEAIFLSTFVLISQNRMQAQADRRADLDLHVSLLAEHEITRLIKLVASMADHMGIQESQDPELLELAQDVLPERVMDEMEGREEKFSKKGTAA